MNRLIALVVLALSVCSPVFAQGLRPVDAAAYDAAVAAGKSQTLGDLVNEHDPLVVRVRRAVKDYLYTTPKRPLDGIVGRRKTLPFLVSIETPFSRVSMSVADATRTFRPLSPPTLDEANAGQFVITVRPGSDFQTADAVVSVVLKRGDVIVQPLQAAVVPLAVQNNFGATRQLSSGRFTFPYDALGADGSLTFVIVGAMQTFPWTMMPEEVQSLDIDLPEQVATGAGLGLGCIRYAVFRHW